MLPPGIGLNAVSEKARTAAAAASSQPGYFEWEPALAAAETGMFPYTPPTSLIVGLAEALAMLREEGLEAVFLRHARHAAATQAAVEAWGFEVYASELRERGTSLTAVDVGTATDAEAV